MLLDIHADTIEVTFHVIVGIPQNSYSMFVKTVVSFLVPLCMWLLFYLLLKVNIPMGPLTFLRDLIDDIL